MTKPDIASANHGTIITIRPLTARGRTWFAEHVRPGEVQDGWQYAPADCEHRYGIDILLAALEAGLKLRDETTGVTAGPMNAREYEAYRRDVLDPRD